MSIMTAGPLRATLAFRRNPSTRGTARLVSEHEGRFVILGNHYLRSDEVQATEHWDCNLYEKTTTLVAEPIRRIRPPEPEANVAIPQAQAPALTEDETRANAREPEDASPLREGNGNGHPSELSAQDELLPFYNAETLFAARPPVKGLVAPHQRVAIFVDGPKMDFARMELGWYIDWNRAARLLVGDAEFGGAFYYDIDPGSENRGRFFEWLSRMGYSLRLERMRTTRNERSLRKTLAITLVIEALNRSSLYDVAFLFTLDNAYQPLVSLLQARGKRVFLITLRERACELALTADKPILYVEDLKDLIQR